MHERTLGGAAALEAVVRLLQRNRSEDALHGLWEAADFCWWWRVARATDDHPQLFWFEGGEPVVAVVATQWRDVVGLDPLTLPAAAQATRADVVRRGVEHATAAGLGTLDVRVDVADGVLADVLTGLGFEARTDEADAEGWLAAGDRPSVSALADGYRLVDRTAMVGRPHHFTSRGGSQVEARLLQTPLYRPDLDLVVLDHDDRAVGYGLFWFDPVTATGLVEPMRTEGGHEGRGLARHVLTAGLERLAGLGAQRIKIAWDPENGATNHLYPDVGFVQTRSTVVFRR